MLLKCKLMLLKCQINTNTYKNWIFGILIALAHTLIALAFLNSTEKMHRLHFKKRRFIKYIPGSFRDENVDNSERQHCRELFLAHTRLRTSGH